MHTKRRQAGIGLCFWCLVTDDRAWDLDTGHIRQDKVKQWK